LAILNIDGANSVTDEDKKLVTKGIIDTTLKMMENIVTQRSSKKRAKTWCGNHNQSTNARTYNTILFQLLVREQHLPARPRDFRLKLADSERNIGRAELSDNLAKFVRINLLERNEKAFPFSRGRPKFESHLSDERRGRRSYYKLSKIKEIIDDVLKDFNVVKSIDNALITSNILYKFLKYSFETALYQIKENPNAFRNSYEPAIKKYGIQNSSNDGSLILIKDLSEDKLKSLARMYAKNTIENFKKDEKNILYTLSALLYYSKSYES
jgi:hypothetical protein